MIAYLVLVLAAFSRLLPHLLHGTGIDITAVGGGLLFFGSRRSRWQAPTAVAVMALTDVYLTWVVFGAAFHVQDYLLTWFWYAIICMLGHGLLRRPSPVRAVLAVFASATGFFLLSNFVVWASGDLYPRTLSGLMASYVAGLPFYGNDLVSTGLTTAVLFGLPVAAATAVRALQARSGQRSAF